MSQAPSSRLKPLYALFAVAGLVLLLMWMEGSFRDKVPPGVSAAVAAEAPVTGPTARVIRRTADEVFAWPGTVTAKIVAQVAPKVPGRILEIMVRGGDRVTAGQVVTRLDAAEIRAYVGQSRAALLSAEAEAERAAADARRLQNLYAREAATRQDLDTAVAAERSTEARVQQAREAVREAESRLGENTLRAPFDGIVVRRNQEPGDVAMPGTAVITVQQTSQLRLESEIPASCAGRIRVGQELKARIANPERNLRAVVDEINPATDPRTRTILVKARLPEPAGAQPGAFGWLYQACGQNDVLLIPAAAVTRIGQLESVRLVVDGQVRLRHIRTGRHDDGQVEVLSGLAEGDTVLLAGAR